MDRNEIIYEELRRLAIGMVPAVLVLVAVLTALGHDPMRASASAVIGVLFALFNFYSIGRSSVQAASQSDPARATRVMQRGFARRYLLTTVYLLIVFVSGVFDLAAGIAPLLFPKVIFLIHHTVRKKGGK